MELLLIILYSLCLLMILVYSFVQLNLLINYLKFKRKKETETEEPSEWPVVSIQLPVYNELYVVERLLDAVGAMDYPCEKMEVQVLDDSTDESVELTRHKVAELKASGLDIRYIHRTHRKGYKAGALKEGMAEAKGEFLAIFDADFIPGPDFLRKTIPHFKNPDIGVVQTRWGHLNRNFSWLTKIQAFALDAHFTIEQVGRNAGNHFINFNGTAGVWRKQCIEEAGNWQSDTITEDLDLSYRSQLKGWKFKYLENVETPAELPILISAARSQQFRWNKGGAENFQKMKRHLFSRSMAPLKTRIHAFFHLLNSTMFVNILLVSLLSIPMLYIKFHSPEYEIFFQLSSIVIISTVIFFGMYWVSYRNIHGGGFRTFMAYIREFVVFYSVAMGFSLQNSVAVLEGHIGKKSGFIRTPKFNVLSLKDNWKGNKYVRTRLTWVNWLEGIMMLYFGFGVISAFILMDYGLLPFHLMLFFGFGFVFYKSVTCRV
ncbi:MAG: glycosyltransferase family 2 protein [Owenweeksia sp.]